MLAVVTGANSGLGLQTAKALAARGARVVLAVRDEAKGAEAAARIGGTTEVRRVDLADLDSVRALAGAITEPVDLLVNNAGIMAPPLQRTAQGRELQFGVNHLAHFALTGLLLDRLRAAERPRVVAVSSQAHRQGRLRWDDLDAHRSYNRWERYGASKLANLLFMQELGRRVPELTSVAAHPGYAATNLQPRGNRARRVLGRVGNLLFAQSDEAGAQPLLQAATATGLPSGAYFGPTGPGEMRGRPGLVGMSRAARDPEDAARLWAVSRELTGVDFE